MAETHVGDLSFTVTGQTGKVYKEDVEGAHQNIIGRNAEDGAMILQFIMADTATNQQILDAAETKFNEKGWY